MLSLARKTFLPFSKVRLPVPFFSQQISVLIQNNAPKRKISSFAQKLNFGLMNSLSTLSSTSTVSINATPKNFYQLNQYRFFASRKAKKMKKEKERQEKQEKKNRGKIPTKQAKKVEETDTSDEPIKKAKKKKSERPKRTKTKNPRYQVPPETILKQKAFNSLRHLNEPIPRIDRMELKALLDSKADILLIDLRLPEHKVGEPGIPNAIEIPVPRIPDVHIPKPKTEEELAKLNKKAEKRKEQEEKEAKKNKGKPREQRKTPEIIQKEAIEALRRELATSEASFQARHKFPKPKQNQVIVFYSSVGMRSDMATKIALELGYSNVRSLYGGSRLWNKFYNAQPLDINALLPPNFRPKENQPSPPQQQVSQTSA